MAVGFSVRLVHYYYFVESASVGNLSFTNSNVIVDLFQKILDKNTQKNADRKFIEKAGVTFTTDVKFHPTEKAITGKLLKVRTDFFPQLINLDDDEIQELLIMERQGIVETTHFYIDYSGNKVGIAIEYNHFGARISDLIRYFYYFKRLYVELQQLKIEIQWVVKDSLSSIPERIGRVSSISATVFKNKIERVNNIENGLFGGAHFAKDNSPTEVVSISHKLDSRKVTATPWHKDLINRFVKAFEENKDLTEDFLNFKVKAEDGAKGNRMEVFDLLVDKERSEVKVTKRGVGKTIDSTEMYDILRREYKAKGL